MERRFNDIHMEFSNEELIVLNEMITVSLLSAKIEFNEVSESVFNKILDELISRLRSEYAE